MVKNISIAAYVEESTIHYGNQQTYSNFKTIQ